MKRLLLVCVLAVFSLLPASSANASAYSTWKWYVSTPVAGRWHDGCLQGQIVDTADNRSYTESLTYTYGCSGSYSSVPSGYLGANAYGYRDGTFCGSTGWYYSAVSTSLFGVGSHLCSNPAGVQTFFTNAYARHWDESGGLYVQGGPWASPSQNY